MTLLRCNFCRNMLSGNVLQLIKTELPSGIVAYTSKAVTITDNTTLTNLYCDNICIVKYMKYQRRLGGLVADLTHLHNDIRFTEFGVTVGHNSSDRCIIVGRDRITDRKKLKLVTDCNRGWVISSCPAIYINNQYLQTCPNKMLPEIPQCCGVT